MRLLFLLLLFGSLGCKAAQRKSSIVADSVSDSGHQIAYTGHGFPFDHHHRPLRTASADQVAEFRSESSQGEFALNQGTTTDYIDMCRKAGVPIPPSPWGQGWKKKGKIPQDRSMIASVFDTNTLYVLSLIHI